MASDLGCEEISVIFSCTFRSKKVQQLKQLKIANSFLKKEKVKQSKLVTLVRVEFQSAST